MRQLHRGAIGFVSRMGLVSSPRPLPTLVPRSTSCASLPARSTKICLLEHR
jgi:hypothetical protein